MRTPLVTAQLDGVRMDLFLLPPEGQNKNQAAVIVITPPTGNQRRTTMTPWRNSHGELRSERVRLAMEVLARAARR
jgi:hypothetical protein